MAALVTPVFWQHWRQLIAVAVIGDVIVSTKVAQIMQVNSKHPKNCQTVGLGFDCDASHAHLVFCQ